MSQEIEKDLLILERLAFLHWKEDNKSIEEYVKLQKLIVAKYKTLFDAMATAGLLTVCLWSSDGHEFIAWDVQSIVENGNFQLNTPVTNQTGNSVPNDKILKEVNEIMK